jgi:hypothetical protein
MKFTLEQAVLVKMVKQVVSVTRYSPYAEAPGKFEVFPVTDMEALFPATAQPLPRQLPLTRGSRDVE